MRIVNYTDQEGYVRSVWIKDEDPDSMAKYGIPVEIPDLSGLDWDGFKRDLHNALLGAGFYTLENVIKAGNAFAPAITVLKRYLMYLYTEDARQDKSSGG